MDLISFIGRIEIKKNLINLIKAVKDLKKEDKFKNLKILIAGPKGYGFEKIEKEAENNKNFVKIIPKFIEEKQKIKILKKSKIIYFASFYEGFGLPILEAQALGKILITSKIGATKEIAGKSAIFVNPYDIEDIKKGIKKALEINPEKIKKLGFENLKRFKPWREVVLLTFKSLTSRCRS